jgi:hypothetical protein
MPLPVLKNLNSNAAAAVTPKVTIWNGDAGDGSYTNDANYTNNAPAEGSTVYVVNSSQAITANLNQSAVSLKEYRIGQPIAAAWARHRHRSRSKPSGW